MIPINTLTAIQSRRSIPNFKNEDVQRNILQAIFTYGSYAPTHYMKEPWRIKLYEKKGTRKLVEAIIASYQHLGMLKSADADPAAQKMTDSMRRFLLKIPHHAVIYFPRETDPARYDEAYASVCTFIQNAQLAAWEYGVGMLWTNPPYMYDQAFYTDIGLDYKTDKIVAVMQIGYPAKIPLFKGRTPIADKMTFITEE
ncbi:nitroreductase family protein [Barrientosiimonas marina]|uniref:Nitroreductase n=1 Tax=Lentibacillus kimchii TaxID=1542911 RepID=A0ABW2USC0_9BACI